MRIRSGSRLRWLCWGLFSREPQPMMGSTRPRWCGKYASRSCGSTGQSAFASGPTSTRFGHREGSRSGRRAPGSVPRADVAGFRDLTPEKEGRVDLAFDRSRVRFQVTVVGDDDDLRIWDGARFILANHYDYAPDRDGYLINRDPKRWLYWLLWSHFAAFRAGPHAFWWMNDEQVADAAKLAGKAEDFVYGGQVDFHGIRCHVVNHQPSWTALFIGLTDGRLRGLRSGASPTQGATFSR